MHPYHFRIPIHLAARIEDADHGKDWLDSCSESYTVRDGPGPAPRPNRTHFEAYERLKGLPILSISDRDVFLQGTWHRDARDLVCSLEPSAHPKDNGRTGIVRMPNLQGQFRLRPVDKNATEVTYALSVDLGGSIPDFVKDQAVREIPRKSLEGLQRLVQQGPGEYERCGQELAAALDATK